MGLVMGLVHNIRQLTDGLGVYIIRMAIVLLQVCSYIPQVLDFFHWISPFWQGFS
jgi:hypothetical protein